MGHFAYGAGSTLCAMDDRDEPRSTRSFLGNVRVLAGERMLGFLMVELADHDDTRGSTWSGRVRGSDYLVWGANGQRHVIAFDDNEQASVVFRSGGTIRGLGPTPQNLTSR